MDGALKVTEYGVLSEFYLHLHTLPRGNDRVGDCRLGTRA